MLLDVRDITPPRSCPVSSFTGAILLDSAQKPWLTQGEFFEDWRSSALSLSNLRYTNSDQCLLTNNRGVIRTAECYNPTTGSYIRSPGSMVVERYYVVDQIRPAQTGRLIKIRTRSLSGVEIMANAHGISLTRTQEHQEELVNPLVSTLFSFISKKLPPLVVDDLLLHAYGPASIIPVRYTTAPMLYDLKRLLSDIYSLAANPLIADEDYLYSATGAIFDKIPTVVATRSLDPKSSSHCAMVEVPFGGIDFLMDYDAVDQSGCTPLVLTPSCQYMFFNKPLFAEVIEVIERLPLTDFKVSALVRAGHMVPDTPLHVEYMCNRYSLFDHTATQAWGFPKMIFDHAAASFCAANKAVFFGQDTLIQITRNHNDEVFIHFMPPKERSGESMGFYYNLTSMTLLSPDLCDSDIMYMRDVSQWDQQYEIL